MINVCDVIMGGGKSSACINYMNEHPDKKYIYITPYLTEAARIREGCPKLDFQEPQGGVFRCGCTKNGHTMELLASGKNIATTHAAFKFYTEETYELIRSHGYTLFIDENVDVLEGVKMSRADLEIAEVAGYIARSENQYYRTERPYDGDVFREVFRMMESRELLIAPGVNDTETLYYWALPPKFIQSFEDVFVLTYMFRGQGLYCMFESNHVPYRYIGIDYDGQNSHFSYELQRSSYDLRWVPDRIHVFDNDKMNRIGDDYYALSMAWYQKNRYKDDGVVQVRKNVYNYIHNYMKDVSIKQVMWASYNEFASQLTGKGIANRRVSFNIRATNEYADRTVMAYPVNLFMNAGQKILFRQNGLDLYDDDYALSTMIQCIFRMAIRNGEDINIYIPSSRMRNLLRLWMADLANGGDGTNVKAAAA